MENCHQTLADLDLRKAQTSTIDLEKDNLVAFVTRSSDLRHFIMGGFDRKLTILDQETGATKSIQLKYYAYCCHTQASLLYVGGMNFIQLFDMSSDDYTLLKTINAGKLIYRMIPIDEEYILCGGSYIVDMVRLKDYRMVGDMCKVETSVYDIALVQTLGDKVDFALATWEGVQFIRVDKSDKSLYKIEILPLKVREKESINNVARVKENMIAFADGSCLILYDRIQGAEILTFWNDSQIRSLKGIPEDLTDLGNLSIQEKSLIAHQQRGNVSKVQKDITSKIVIVKGEKGIAVIQMDLNAKEVFKQNLMLNDECNNVFADCLSVEKRLEKGRQRIEVLATGNYELEDNVYERRIRTISIPIINW
ncbi:hypothetical protein FGO68_gene12286 [Halteria grandinella]|uniref:Uncharacterized protein n=1 Tax=Halteria grandinella TaxID=5974 RepID=A0A8J8T658_HALGN|nr:hypothetical protein FGO68_gene12286 [Halteria grandinella]